MKHLYALIVITVLLHLVWPVWGQINPDGGVIYLPGEVAEIRITMSEMDKHDLLDEIDQFEDIYYPCDISFRNSMINETVLNVGIRLRGNTSRSHPKRSLKIDFREFGGSKFHDIKKFNLKAENNDPSMTREHLSLQVFRSANVPAARSHHVQVYINNEYMGLYLNVEQIDDEFVELRFGNDTGNLYKCYWGSTLENDGQIFDESRYELKTNEEINDRAILKNMVEILNGNPSDEWPPALESVFNVSGFIRYLAVEALVGHWDGYSYNKNNFYLYEDPNSGLIEFIVYDVDNTFGIDWIGRDWGTRHVLDWPKHGDPRPLVSRILGVDSYRQRFIYELARLLNGTFSEELLAPLLEEYRDLLDEAVRDDAYFTMTFGFDHQMFRDSFEQDDLAGHLPYGILSYILTRTSTAIDQIPEVVLGDHPDIDLVIYPNPVRGNRIFIQGLETNFFPVQATDIKGKRVPLQPSLHPNGTWQVQLAGDLAPGLYFFYIQGQIRKILKN